MTSPSADYQGVLGGAFQFGEGTDFTIARTGDQSIIGLVASPNVRTTDLEPIAADGVLAGIDSYAARILQIPIKVTGSDAADARDKLSPFLDAWRTPRTSIVPLDLRMPGTPETVMRYFGRARAIDEANIMWHHRAMWIKAHFDALDPWAYGAEHTVEADTSSPVTVENAGSLNTARVVLTIVGNGGIPKIVNSSAPDLGDITFRTTVANGVTRVIDLKTWSTSTTGGAVKDSEVSPASLWFDLIPGNNTLTYTNLTSLAAVVLPAYP